MNESVLPTLELSNLSLGIGKECKINSLNFKVFPGERVCLLGASGSGKSLTARAATGTLPEACRVSGEIWVNGENVTYQPALARKPASRVAAVFQDSAVALNPLVRTGKQLAMAAGYTTADSLTQMLNKAGLGDIPDLLRRYPAELSGGQRQRLCTVLALLSRSALLVADEPTTALDVIAQRQIIELLLQRYAQPNAPALLFITHDIAVAAQLCQRGLVLEHGQLVESASMTQLLNAPRHPYTRRLVGAALRNSAAVFADAEVKAG